jgi:deferrochelatase/peroxidase EfeB
VTARLPPGYSSTQLQGISDLTVLATVKRGFVPGAFERETFAERLRRVLTALNLTRQAREWSPLPSPFPDSIGRFRIIHFFRFALLPPPPSTDPGQDPPPTRLLLNVTFDGAWEPYMRVIWGPLGALLDLVFCHCEDYPYAFQSSYADYVAWVRSREVSSLFFFTDSPATVADSRYLAALQALQLERGDMPGADAALARFALRSPETVMPSPHAAQLAKRVLMSLYALQPLFPRVQGDDDQEGFLLRFARDVLADLRDWIALRRFEPGGPLASLNTREFVPAKIWLMQTPVNELAPSNPAAVAVKPAARVPRAFSPQLVQAGIAAPYPPQVDHGALLLLVIVEQQKFRGWLASTTWVTPGDAPPEDGVFRNLAFTYAGLQRLDVPPEVLAKLPREFFEGMEARAGVLGDVRGNHPRQWRRPRTGPDDRPIELSVVHVVAQLRTASRNGDQGDGMQVLPRLQKLANSFAAAAGLRLLHIQPMRTTDPEHRGHFDLADGFSQPRLDQISPPPSYWNDQVTPGELFLGYPNARDRSGFVPDEENLLDDGSFLVVRKLRQHVERWQRALESAAKQARASLPPTAATDLPDTLKSKLLGRTPDGAPLVAVRGPGSNDFDYRHDAEGMQCPFQSHVRRANPRTATPGVPVPRIARRGMSYGPPHSGGRDPHVDAQERGIVFMAYNASIAEQFEVIQRWLAGGNSSGVASAMDDPFVGVPEAGRKRIFRCVEERSGTVLRIDLGDDALVTLEWGLYAFAPSLPALHRLGKIGTRASVTRGAAPTPPAAVPGAPTSDKEHWALLLEDTNSREAGWQRVRAEHGVKHAGEYGWLVSDPDEILRVLKDDGSDFSVRGYGERFEHTVGMGYLGEDDNVAGEGHARRYVREVNDAIAGFRSEAEAFGETYAMTDKLLEATLATGERVEGGRRCSVDFALLPAFVIARASAKWFGLPDAKGEFMEPAPRSDDPDAKAACPGHFLSVSRYIFSPWPSDTVGSIAQGQGQKISEAVHAWLSATEAARESRGPLTQSIIAALEADGADMDEKARIVTGVIVGFPATVFGNVVSVLRAWTQGTTLWDLQQELSARADGDSYVAAESIVRAPLLATMKKAAVPYVIWREAARRCTLKGQSVEPGQRIVLGLGAAMQPPPGQPAPHDTLMFGGAYGDTVHACPAYSLAIGFMLGLLSALLNKGFLQRETPRSLLLVARA